ncbi:hypothetical protein [Actinophytocola oryzae]|uniref:hypothetical protein n=1 Tax=Actinophytocola oryzae TaxID=502181 RepID=UPI001FBA0FA3|nr:hypothetical protein [Actinophytocola oryzae]
MARETSPPETWQARRSTSVVVSTATRGRPRTSRTPLSTARFSRTGISAGCSSSTQDTASSLRIARSASPSGVTLPAMDR